jgi:general secretion pathway protein D
MEIEQSVEDVKETGSGGSSIDSPTIATREINSSVAVQNGEAIVLGGLITEDNTYNKSGVPFLHTLPLIGPLFGGTVNNKDRTELVVLITPRVVQSRQDARLISDEFKRKLSGIYQEVPVYIDKTTVR